VLGLAGVVAAAVVLTTKFDASADSRADAATDDRSQYVYQVSAPTDAEAQRLSLGGFDLLERRSGGNLFVLGDAATADRLRGAGFPPSSVQEVAAIQPTARVAAGSVAPIDETYAGGYHTVAAHDAHLDAVASAHPDLATVVDYGDSYLKTEHGGQPRLYATAGHDLKAICLTRRQAGDCELRPGATKPRFVLMAQLHARELVTGDIAWRFIDHLVNDTDSAVASLLDSNEVWVVPIANPDGVERVQQGGNRPTLQRKNMHGTGCGSSAANQPGVDLNRNAAHRWNTTGVSSDVCHQTYPGTGAESEPETIAIASLFRALFADQRRRRRRRSGDHPGRHDHAAFVRWDGAVPVGIGQQAQSQRRQVAGHRGQDGPAHRVRLRPGRRVALQRLRGNRRLGVRRAGHRQFHDRGRQLQQLHPRLLLCRPRLCDQPASTDVRGGHRPGAVRQHLSISHTVHPGRDKPGTPAVGRNGTVPGVQVARWRPAPCARWEVTDRATTVRAVRDRC
jgi:hypothetical protein